MTSRKEVSTLAITTPVLTIDGDARVDSERDAQCRRLVGHIQWELPIMPDFASRVKALAGDLNEPT